MHQIFSATDYTTGEVAAALVMTRQNVTNFVSRASLPTSGTGSHTRLSFAQAVAVAVGRDLAEGGLSIFVAGLAVRNVLPALAGFADYLVEHVKNGSDPLSDSFWEKHSPPFVAGWVQHRSWDGENESICRFKIVRQDKIGEVAADPVTALGPNVRPVMLVVALLPVLRQLAKGLLEQQKGRHE
ncbi:hypothetical protein ACQW02_16140 [Humitalea sp. 24SJ18S-53]|uniref:hypothetical protein n=1 Tax=Humitalea sp. 24SJ18S-53 TaxID=3422307 RepID=UPI003D666C9C